jgi:hypothetical protein
MPTLFGIENVKLRKFLSFCHFFLARFLWANCQSSTVSYADKENKHLKNDVCLIWLGGYTPVYLLKTVQPSP